MRYRWTMDTRGAETTYLLTDTLLGRVVHQQVIPAGFRLIDQTRDAETPREALGQNVFMPARGAEMNEFGQIVQPLSDGRRYIEGELYEPVGSAWIKVADDPFKRASQRKTQLVFAGLALAVAFFWRRKRS